MILKIIKFLSLYFHLIKMCNVFNILLNTLHFSEVIHKDLFIISFNIYLYFNKKFYKFVGCTKKKIGLKASLVNFTGVFFILSGQLTWQEVNLS